MTTNKPQSIKDKVQVWWELYCLILNDEEVRAHLSSKLDQSRHFYERWGSVTQQTFEEWWKDFGLRLFLKSERKQQPAIERLTAANLTLFNLKDPNTFAVVISAGATPASVARTIKSLYRRHLEATYQAPAGKKWRVRIPVYEVRMRWFQEVGRASFLGRLRGNELIAQTRIWFTTNASWINEKGYPMENWTEPLTTQDLAKQRTMTHRIDTFMRDALTFVAEGKFLRTVAEGPVVTNENHGSESPANTRM